MEASFGVLSIRRRLRPALVELTDRPYRVMTSWMCD